MDPEAFKKRNEALLQKRLARQKRILELRSLENGEKQENPIQQSKEVNTNIPKVVEKKEEQDSKESQTKEIKEVDVPKVDEKKDKTQDNEGMPPQQGEKSNCEKQKEDEKDIQEKFQKISDDINKTNSNNAQKSNSHSYLHAHLSKQDNRSIFDTLTNNGKISSAPTPMFLRIPQFLCFVISAFLSIFAPDFGLLYLILSDFIAHFLMPFVFSPKKQSLLVACIKWLINGYKRMHIYLLIILMTRVFVNIFDKSTQIEHELFK